MNTKLIELAGKIFGPKVSAVVAGGITVAGQVESRLAMSDTDATAVSVVVDALASGNISAAIPGLIAAGTAYSMRQAKPVEKKPPGEENVIYGSSVDTSPIGGSSVESEEEAYERYEKMHAHYPLDPRNDEDSLDHDATLEIPAGKDDSNLEDVWDAMGMLTHELKETRLGLEKRITELDRAINTNGVGSQLRDHKEQVRELTADLKKQIIGGNSRIMSECAKQTEDIVTKEIGDGFEAVATRFNNVKQANKQRDARIESLQFEVQQLQKPGDASNYNVSDDIISTATTPEGQHPITFATKSQPGLEKPMKKRDGGHNDDVHGEYFGDPVQPLGIRQNNIGNIRPTKAGKTAWKGEMASKTAYAAFKTPEHGIRAMMYLLRKSYFQKHGLKTVVDIIHRWSPYGDPGNSRASVDNYVIAVASALGKAPNQELNLRHNDEVLITMVKAMAKFENGKDVPYDDETFDKALELLK